jgi:Protein of unknown function (DUF3738)
MQAYNVKDYQIAGMPGWGEWRGDRFDVVAKAEGSGTPQAGQVRQVLRHFWRSWFRRGSVASPSGHTIYSGLLRKSLNCRFA